MIDSLYTRDSQGAPERLVQHLIEAEALDHAIAPLFYLITVYHVRNEYDRAEQYLEQLEEILYELEIPASDIRHGRLRLMRCSHVLQASGVRAAWGALDRVLEQTETEDNWQALRGEVLVLRGKLELLRGEFTACLTSCMAASEQFAEAGGQLGLASCFVLQGQLYAMRHEYQEAKRYVRAAMDLCKEASRADHPYTIDDLMGSAYSVLGYAYKREHKLEKATLAMKRAIRHFKEVGDRHGANLTHNNLGDLARAHHNFEAAERFYLDARDLLDEIDHGASAIPTLNYGLALIEQDRHDEALAHVERALGQLDAIGYELYLPLAYLAAACCHAAAADMSSWRLYHDQAQRRLEPMLLADPDVAALAEATGDLLAHEHPQEALSSYEIAQDQLELIDADETRQRNLRHRVNLTVDRLPRRLRRQRRHKKK